MKVMDVIPMIERDGIDKYTINKNLHRETFISRLDMLEKYGMAELETMGGMFPPLAFYANERELEIVIK